MIRDHLRHISKSKPLRAVLRVLSLSGFFCDAPNLTPSDKKLGHATLNVHISLVPSETITNYSLLITNCILTPSPEKLGRATLNVHISLVPSDSYAERAKEAERAEAAEGDLLITNFRSCSTNCLNFHALLFYL